MLRLRDKPRPRVSWTADTIDNEGMGKKKSNRKSEIMKCAASITGLEKKAVTHVPVTTRETPWKGIDIPSICIRKSVLN